MQAQPRSATWRSDKRVANTKRTHLLLDHLDPIDAEDDDDDDYDISSLFMALKEMTARQQQVAKPGE